MNNNNPTSKKLTFNELIDEHQIEIPIIQRDYAQGREGKEDIRTNFLKALLKAVEESPLELDFVYGSVKEDILQPLDGQQRLTTLFLLHWYIAIKENKLGDKVKELLKKFTYETRTSSRDFCTDLINKGIVLKEGKKLSELIIDSPWFFLSWKRDPTIKAMLTMLDAIEKKFEDKTNVWDKLKNISFHYIELQNFGLSDDLYIKMNARGKLLTDFENFKAKFEQLIAQENWETSLEGTENFSHKIDTQWTDLFWNHRNKESNLFDEQLLNFFRTMAINNYALKKDIKSDSFRDHIDLLRDNSKPISFNKYLELECFDENYFKTLKAVLNKISDEGKLKEFLPDTPYIKEKDLFSEAIQGKLGYANLVTLFALYQYLALEENTETEKLTNWVRIVRNLVEGSRPYNFNHATEFANALRSVSKLLEHRNSIIEYFAETQEDSLAGFIKDQVGEEKLKSKLILQSNEWKEVIIETENHGYFNGQIGFLLDWCKDENDEVNIDKFKEYAEKSKTIFNEKGLKEFNDFLFERAMLATGDYLLDRGKNYSFLINERERDISWKRLLRGDKNENRKVLKDLIDKISVTTLTKDLEKIVDDFDNVDDWRHYFIKQPDMIKACKNQKLIRWNSESDILLLGSTTTRGYHKEYYSYSLCVELGKESYFGQCSVNDWKYFKYGDKQIAFDCENKEFVWTEKDEWDKKKAFKDRDSLISELTNKDTFLE